MLSDLQHRLDDEEQTQKQSTLKRKAWIRAPIFREPGREERQRIEEDHADHDPFGDDYIDQPLHDITCQTQ